MANTSLKVFSKKKAHFLLVLAKRIVPPVGDLDEAEQMAVVKAVDEALALRTPAIQLQFKVFLDLIRLSTLVRHRKTLERLPFEKLDVQLTKLENHPVAKFRTGFWGVKTLIYMGYYGDPDRAAQFDYTPSLKGNERLHENQGS